MGMIKPRKSRFRINIGTRSRENGANGDLLFGISTYNHDQVTGLETYEVNYITVGGRSDGLSNTLQTLQGNEPTTRYVEQAGEDELYVGTPKQNAGRIAPVATVPVNDTTDPLGVLHEVKAS